MTEGAASAEERGGRSARRWLLGAALAAPLVAAPLLMRVLVDGLAQRGGAELCALSTRLDGLSSAAPRSDPRALPPASDPEQVATPDARAEREPSSASSPALPARAEGRGGSAPPKGLRIRAAVVARAARSGARPSGTPVSASGPRPAGLALQGVGQIGAGLRDGDVLTSVGGAPARSVDSVIAAVAGALRARAPLLSAVVWRGDQPIQVVVELPRPRS